MSKRFLPILDELPDCCDWELHVLTLVQPVLEGDTNRSTHSAKSKKLVAAALCQEAKKLNATGAAAAIEQSAVQFACKDFFFDGRSLRLQLCLIMPFCQGCTANRPGLAGSECWSCGASLGRDLSN